MSKLLALAAVVVLLVAAAPTAAGFPPAGGEGSAEGKPAAAAAPAGDTEADHPLWIGLLMLVLLFGAFFSMTRYNIPLPLAMTVVSCLFLALQWGKVSVPGSARAVPASMFILKSGFEHYAPIVILFTAVAIPAHMIERSNGFRWIAAYLAYRLEVFRLRSPRLALPLLVFVLLAMTYVTAGLMHNITSILIMTPIIIRLCDSFEVPSRWLLCGALVASNLGGFSTKWGDTPNIVESDVWSLTAGDFLREVVPANLIVLLVLMAVVLRLTRASLLRQAAKSPEESRVTAYGETIVRATTAVGWKKARKTLYIDRRLLLVGLGCLGAFIVLHVVYDEYKIVIGALTIAAAVLMERSEDRLKTLKSLGFDVYLTFAAIFVLAGCVEHSWIGDSLRHLIEQTGGAAWSIALTGFLGTTFTEAASWATAASPQIFPTASGHAAAWALGGGICAGSSSLVTAASAGIILAEESGRFREPHAITFRRYLPFGLAFALFMLAFYAAYFTIFHY